MKLLISGWLNGVCLVITMNEVAIHSRTASFCFPSYVNLRIGSKSLSPGICILCYYRWDRNRSALVFLTTFPVLSLFSALGHIQKTYFLVNVVDNDNCNESSDIFTLFKVRAWFLPSPSGLCLIFKYTDFSIQHIVEHHLHFHQFWISSEPMWNAGQVNMNVWSSTQLYRGTWHVTQINNLLLSLTSKGGKRNAVTNEGQSCL